MHDTTTDAELVAAHLGGDASALAAIYDRYADSLHDTAAAMTRQRHDAADVLQDVFVVAAERMGQLRDPDKLKPWLFAILRNEVYRRTRRRRRTVATDFSDPVVEMAAPTQHPDDGSRVEYEELAALVRGAAAGLEERDRLVLELSIRQGLEGDDLAAALGVSAQQSYGLVHRMRQRTERSLGAYCVARTGRRDCAELDELLRGWDGEFSVLIRKRVARHVDGCETCERSRRGVAPFALFGAAPVLAAPIELRDRILTAAGGPNPSPPYGFEAAGGFPSAIGKAVKFGMAALFTGAAIVVTLGAAVLLTRDDTVEIAGAAASDDVSPSTSPSTVLSTAEPVTTVAPTTSTRPAPATAAATRPTTAPTTTAPTTSAPTTVPSTTAAPTSAVAPGSLSLSATLVDFGADLDTAAITLTNSGGEPVSWSTGPIAMRAAPTPFVLDPTSGTLAPGETARVTVSIDRDWPTEGPLTSRRITFVADGTSATVELRGTIARPPAIDLLLTPPTATCMWNLFNGLQWSATIVDESPPIADARVEVVLPSGATETLVMTPVNGYWDAGFFPDGDNDNYVDPGDYSWRLSATDSFGNVGSLHWSISVSPETADCPP